MGSVLSSCSRQRGQRGHWLEESSSACNRLKTICTDKEAVAKLLECPICYEICFPPIFLCEIGHHICKNCKDRVTQCPICRANFQGTRNFFLENYFEQNCRLSCRYAKEGCKEILAGKDLKAHQEKCSFRPVPCPLCKNQNPTVTNFISISDYLTHLVNVHQARYIGRSLTGEIVFCILWNNILSYISRILISPNGDLPTRIWEPRLIKFHGYKFLAVNVLRNFEMTFFVSIFGNENEANQFYVQCTIETKTKGSMNRQMPHKIAQLIGSVIPIRSSESAHTEYKESKLMYNINLLRVCENLKPETKVRLTCKLVKKKCRSPNDLMMILVQNKFSET